MSADATSTPERLTVEPKHRSNFMDIFIRLLKEKPLGTFGAFIVFTLLLTGIFATWLAPFQMNQIDLLHSLEGPTALHPLGTDNLGRDVLSNIIYGARISIIIGLSATSLVTVTAISIGSLSAFIGGKFDMFVQRFVDAWMSIPPMLTLLIMMSILGKGMWQMIVAIGIPMGIGSSRMIRSATIRIRENMYVEAGRAIGATTGRMMMKHILPNIMPVVIIGFSMQIGGVIMMEAGLSFLGYGVPPGVPSWGSMLSQEGRTYMEIAPALAFWPGFALSMVVYGTNMFGDALRDLQDPRLKGGLGSYGGPRKKLKIQTKM